MFLDFLPQEIHRIADRLFVILPAIPWTPHNALQFKMAAIVSLYHICVRATQALNICRLICICGLAETITG